MYEYLAAHAGVALVAPRMVDEDGVYQQSCHYFTVLDARHALLYLLVLLGGRGAALFGMSSDPCGDGRGPVEVDWVYTACALARREALDEVGLLDEDLFMYGEDMELCYRIARGGWRTVYLPQAEITHYGNRSGEQVFGDLQGYTRARMYVDGIDYFQRKYFSAAHSYIIRGLICAGSAAAAALLGLLYLLKGGDAATGARSFYAAKVAAASLRSMLAAPPRSTADMKERQRRCARWS
jgi:GT2 family glycosyltransferase